MIINFKWLEIPFTNKTKSIEVPQLWEVRWTSRHGSFNSDTQPEMEAFTSQEQADDFAKSLANAFKLIKHTSGNTITVRKSA